MQYVLAILLFVGGPESLKAPNANHSVLVMAPAGTLDECLQMRSAVVTARAQGRVPWILGAECRLIGGV
ncbi:hypothetical protein UFOVP411_47 [uncultured Caudovirales phage]|uniref:Uncharacterized protein n=1 Tax=uncultured Caudovirales phage TaxID=2100421 RepID=A0A6J5M2U5_9CAUD|nr:hypothetical protein UFOVP411_47 [uncultured Caudovirales phage]